MPHVSNVRIWAAVPADVNDRLNEWSGRLGITKSMLINLAVQSGLSSLIRAVAPEDAFSPAVLAKIILAAKEQGEELTFSDMIPEKVVRHGE